MSKNNVIWHHSTVSRSHKEKLHKHKGAILWFTGLPCSGKSTLAHAVEDYLYRIGCRTFVLDGDNVRHGLCSDLGFGAKDRHENIRRIGEVAKLFLESASIVITAFISPFKADREYVRGLVPHGDFYEIFCNASLSVCVKRDVKGMYKMAQSGQIANFTGVSSPYEKPSKPDLVLNTGQKSLATCVSKVIDLIHERGIIYSK